MERSCYLTFQTKIIPHFTLLPLRGETSVDWFTLRVASLCVGLNAGCPFGAWVVCYIPLLFYDNVMALFAITFSGGIDIVLFLLTLGLKAQKHLARGRASASPRVNVPNDFRPASGKSVTYLLLRNAIFLNYRIKFARLR